MADDEYWFDFVQEIESLIDEHKNVNLYMMGFPDNWTEYLINEKNVVLGAT